jgi:hypothetical protein
LPPKIVASAAMTARYAGALVADPIPVGWKPCKPAGPACRGYQRAAAEDAGAEQRALGHQRDHGQADEQQHAGIRQDALDQPVVDEHRVVLGRVCRRVMAAGRVELGRPRHGVCGELGDPARRVAGREVGPQPGVGAAAPA